MLVGVFSTVIRFEQTYNEHSQVCTDVSAFCANTQTKIQTVTHTHLGVAVKFIPHFKVLRCAR